MPHLTGVCATNLEGINFAKWLQLYTKSVQNKGTVWGVGEDKLSSY